MKKVNPQISQIAQINYNKTICVIPALPDRKSQKVWGILLSALSDLQR